MDNVIQAGIDVSLMADYREIILGPEAICENNKYKNRGRL
jgi:hypothetical protein